MKVIPLAVFFSLINCITYAQKKGNAVVKRMFFHSHGISFQKFENLNKRITAYPQFEPAKNSTGTLQFGIVAQRKRIINGYSINAGSSLSGDREKKSTGTSFFGISADVGYNILKSTGVLLYPFAGLGYEGYKIKLNRDVSTFPFDSILTSGNFQQRAENLVFNNSFMLYKVGLGLVVTSKKHVRNSIGLQVDYSGSFKSNSWKINKSQMLLNSPKDNLSKIGVSLLIRYQLGRGGKD